MKDIRQEIPANNVEFVIERSKPKNEIGINLKIANCSSGEKSIEKFFLWSFNENWTHIIQICNLMHWSLCYKTKI